MVTLEPVRAPGTMLMREEETRGMRRGDDGWRVGREQVETQSLDAITDPHFPSRNIQYQTRGSSGCAVVYVAGVQHQRHLSPSSKKRPPPPNFSPNSGERLPPPSLR